MLAGVGTGGGASAAAKGAAADAVARVARLAAALRQRARADARALRSTVHHVLALANYQPTLPAVSAHEAFAEEESFAAKINADAVVVPEAFMVEQRAVAALSKLLDADGAVDMATWTWRRICTR